MNTPDFSIIFPVMNQADHIGKVIRSYHAKLSKNKFSFELIPVVNCTTDESFSVCQEAAKHLSGVYPYEIKECGYGRGIIYGLQKSHGKYLGYLNCARIHESDLVRALKHFQIDDSVIVHGVRLRRENEKRRLGSLAYNIFCRALFKIPNRFFPENRL